MGLRLGSLSSCKMRAIAIVAALTLGVWVVAATIEDGPEVARLDDGEFKHDSFLDRLRDDTAGVTLMESGIHKHVKKIINKGKKARKAAKSAKSAAKKLAKKKSMKPSKKSATVSVVKTSAAGVRGGSLMSKEAEADTRAAQTRADLSKAVKEITGTGLGPVAGPAPVAGAKIGKTAKDVKKAIKKGKTKAKKATKKLKSKSSLKKSREVSKKKAKKAVKKWKKKTKEAQKKSEEKEVKTDKKLKPARAKTKAKIVKAKKLSAKL